MSAQTASKFKPTPKGNDLPVVVLVDDEPGILLALKAILRRRYKVISTSDPTEAAELVRINNAEVIISDQKMPGMTGVEVLRSVRSQSPRTTRILLTGFSDRNDITASINESEVFRFISKPWDNDRLRTAVSDAVAAAHSWVEKADDRDPLEPELSQEGSSAANVLVIDRDQQFIDQLESVMPQKYALYTAENIEQAIEYFRLFPVGVVISDLDVDERNNVSFLQALKRKYPEIIICVATCDIQSERLIEMINNARIFYVFNKPVGSELAARALNAAIGYHRVLQRKSGMQKAQIVEDIEIMPDRNHQKSRIRAFLSQLWNRPATRA